MDVIAEELETRIREQLVEVAEEIGADPKEVASGEPITEEWVRHMGAEHWEAVAEGTGLHPWHLSRAVLEGMASRSR